MQKKVAPPSKSQGSKWSLGSLVSKARGGGDKRGKDDDKIGGDGNMRRARPFTLDLKETIFGLNSKEGGVGASKAPRMTPPRFQDASETTVKVEWSPPPLAGHFELQYAKAPALVRRWRTACDRIEAATSNSTFTITALEPGQAYIVRLRAAYFEGTVLGAYSEESELMYTHFAVNGNGNGNDAGGGVHGLSKSNGPIASGDHSKREQGNNTGSPTDSPEQQQQQLQLPLPPTQPASPQKVREVQRRLARFYAKHQPEKLRRQGSTRNKLNHRCK